MLQATVLIPNSPLLICYKMFLEEKIDRLKQTFLPAEFKVPFTDGSDILKAIEAKFIVAKDVSKDPNNLRQRFNHWADNIKNKTAVKPVDLNNHTDWLDKLDPGTNYWAVTTDPGSPSAKHLVYDCKPKALVALISITQGDFFIVDKKYNWFTWFRVNRQINQAELFKSGTAVTPFEM